MQRTNSSGVSLAFWNFFTVVLNDYSFVTRFVTEPLDDVLRNPAREALI